MVLLLVSLSSLAVAAEYHTVKRGDTLYLLARRYGTTVSALREANNLKSNTLYPGQTLIIPGASSSPSGSYQTYIVKPGDSLWLLSVRFDTTVQAIKAANNLSGDNLYVGQRIVIPGSESSQSFTRYTVKAGDSLFKIASLFNTSIDVIKRANNLRSNTIYVGQVLSVPGSARTPQDPNDGSKISEGTVYVHAVKWWESLNGIAQRYGVSTQSLVEANKLPNTQVNSSMALMIEQPKRNISELRKFDVPAGVSVTDFHKLARIVYAEAGSEPYTGQIAVAAVILNRIDSPRFPNTLEGVITQKYQFEAVYNGYYYRTPPSLDSYKAAMEALRGKDPTSGALFFYNPDKVTNRWLLSKPITYRVGSHVFAR